MCLAGCAAGVPAGSVEGRYVEVHSDLGETEAQTLALEADSFVERVCAYLQARPPGARVYVFRNVRGLRAFLRRECPAFAARVGACFEGRDGGLVVAVLAKDGGRPSVAKLRHELTHAVVAANFRDAMPWLDEGLAQVFESGCPPAEDRTRIRALRKNAVDGERLERLFAVTERAELSEKDYLVAWGMTWCLVREGERGRRTVLECLAPARAGENAVERVRRCTGGSLEQRAQNVNALIARDGRPSDVK